MLPLRELIPILQTAIGPVILISGVGLLLLTMTNRFGRVIDRTRAITREIRAAAGEDRASATAQLQILMKRAQIIRAAIACSALSALLAAVLVIMLFLGAIMGLEHTAATAVVFIACMIFLIAGLLLFIGDINLSLNALKLEVGVPEGHGR